MYHNRIIFLLDLRQVYIEFMIHLVITDIVQVNEFLGAMYIDLRYLPATEASLRLGGESYGT